MRFNELVDVVDVVMRSKHVPIVIGHAGIGKSQLAKVIASKNGFDVVTLYGSLLKEGELN